MASLCTPLVGRKASAIRSCSRVSRCSTMNASSMADLGAAPSSTRFQSAAPRRSRMAGALSLTMCTTERLNDPWCSPQLSARLQQGLVLSNSESKRFTVTAPFEQSDDVLLIQQLKFLRRQLGNEGRSTSTKASGKMSRRHWSHAQGASLLSDSFATAFQDDFVRFASTEMQSRQSVGKKLDK